MRKILVILIACLSWLISYAQTRITEKEFISKYNLPVNFFDSSYNAKEHIATYYESLPKSDGKNVLPPGSLVTEAVQIFMMKKMFDKAFWLLRMNIENYPNNYKSYREMGDYYIATGDKDRAYVYYSRALTVKYKQPSILSDSSIKIDAEIAVDYKKLSEETGREPLPTEYLIAPIADNLLKLKKNEAAYRLYKMNYENNPGSYTAIDNFGNYYEYVGDSANAFRYWAKSVTLRYKLPDNFFSTSFNPLNYLNTFYSKPAGTSVEKALPPEQMVNVLGYIFLAGKMFDKAEMLFKLNIENNPNSSNVFDSMADFYEATGNDEKKNKFRQQFEKIKLKNPSGRREVIADTTFDTRVADPACNMNCPVILFDEAHNNYHTAGGRYKAFASLMENDGFKVIRGQSPFTNQLLAQVNVVAIASLGFPSQIPISLTEIQILNNWVTKGGSLFVITDHDNLAIDELLHSVGVETQEINVTHDSLHGRFREDGVTINPGNIFFSQTDKLLGNHSILRGRNDAEKIKFVQTYAGRTVIGPSGSTPLLLLSNSAIDYMVVDPSQGITSRIPVKTKGLRTHGVAFNFGKGKVVVVGEAAMLTAQLWPPNYTPNAGMNVPGSDNKQFALNIMRWLTGYLK